MNTDITQERKQAIIKNSVRDNAIVCKPLLKWPGGKRNILKYILPLIPAHYNRYFEPFFGGGALFFALQPRVAILADKNPELINCYKQVRDRPADVIAHLKKLKNSEKSYYKIRAAVPETASARAARLIYLLTLSFNGIHRLNLKGEFNVPYGYKVHLQPCDSAKLITISRVLSSAKLYCQDFEATVKNIRDGDVVYLDPPYTVAHGNNGFIKYNEKIYSWDDQVRLASLAKDLVQRGCKVIISNADHPSIHLLYRDFKLLKVERGSVIAASDKYRRKITECIYYNED